jgi:4-diphosphocytidyl-2-C-methyl-D-erythritol kinase
MNTALTELRDVPAPAKLNLFLHIVGRRADGYHLLQSVFMLIDWCDTLHFRLRQDGVIRRIDAVPGSALPEIDLVVRAARALQVATGCALGADITLEKRLPAEAGLGGGSSDAASTLLALNRLWQLGLPRARLADIGLALGADVPFFIGGRNAWVEGVGEQLTPVDLPPGRFVVVKPPTGASTAAIFGSPVCPIAPRTGLGPRRK